MTTGRANQDDAPLGATVTQAAELLGVTRRTLYRWRDKGWLVHHPDGGVDVEATRTKVQANADPARSPTALSALQERPNKCPPSTGTCGPWFDAVCDLPDIIAESLLADGLVRAGVTAEELADLIERDVDRAVRTVPLVCLQCGEPADRCQEYPAAPPAPV